MLTKRLTPIKKAWTNFATSCVASLVLLTSPVQADTANIELKAGKVIELAVNKRAKLIQN